MPAKINMFLSNGNFNLNLNANRFPLSSSLNLAVVPSPAPAPATPSINVSGALNTSIISRIHNIRPGCGSCGRK